MQNEIFARYGYAFIKGGKMEKYFKSQEWYKAEKSNVNDFLTKIEMKNIERIKRAEKR